jgi:lipopolysaccharide export system protein LptA
MTFRSKLFLFVILSLVVTAGHAKKSDKHQTLIITSEWQEFTQDGYIVYRDNVELKQGTLHLNADKVVVEFDQKVTTKISAEGAPTTYKQQGDDGVWLNAEAARFEFYPRKDELVMHDVTLEQGLNTVQSEKITYNIETQRFTARRGKTIRQPEANTPAIFRETEPTDEAIPPTDEATQE